MGDSCIVSAPRRIVRLLVVLAVLWLGALLVLGFVYQGRTQRGVAERVGDSLQGTATIGDASLGLIRGTLTLDELAITRDDVIGHLEIKVAHIDCSLPPLGLALVDRDCRKLALRGLRLEVSTAALFKLKPPKRPPLRVGRVVIDDAQLEFSASALMPSFGRVAIAIQHAEAGETIFKTPLSWIFALETLRATVELPAGITLHLSYDAGQLRVSGGLFGSIPILVPVALPVRDLADDPRAELAKLVAFAKDLAEKLVARKAEDVLKSF